MLPSTLQALTKKVLATQLISEDDYYTLKCCGLWWHEAPLMLCYDKNHQMLVKTPILKEGLLLNTALMKAVQENNYELIMLFTEWGANINYGLLSVNMEHTRNLCRKLGAKEGLEASEILQFFFKIKRHKTSSNIILCHELFSNNLLLQNVDMEELKMIIYWDLKDLTDNIILDDNTSLSEMLTKYWYGIAVRYKLKEAIQYFYQEYEQLNEWRLNCALSFNNVFDLHEIHNTGKVYMDIDEMMRLACIRDNNFLTIYYCFALGADINQAMFTSILNYNVFNMFFCMDLGANAIEESKALAEQKNYHLIVNMLSFKNYSPDPFLISKIIDPKKINTMLKSYYSKNMSTFDYMCIGYF
uniref:MGF 360-1L CDS n=1 Tax=African swine fever virus TaxID=10497 RepID=A0A7R8V8R8_ASF|nr:MGF 360-1L CDS [African swine fever virus]